MTGWGTSIAAALAFITAGCAHIEAPKGGPEDREPPRIIAMFPDSGAVRVPLTDSLVFVFSEPVDRRSIEDAFFITPPPEYLERRWKGETWSLRLREPLRPAQTYALLLGVEARDRHRVALTAPWTGAFSTGDSLDSGTLSGRVIGQRYPGKGAFVYAWPWEADPPDTTMEGFARDPLRLGQADAQGAYTLGYLPRGRGLRICAHYDQNGNRSFDPGRDLWSCVEEAVVLADTGAVAGAVDLYFADPDEPGAVAGALRDSVCAASDAVARLARGRAAADSLRRWLAGEDLDDLLRSSAGADSGDAVLEALPVALPRALSADDSLRVGRELLEIDALLTVAGAESAYCARPLVAQLLAGDSTVVRESSGPAFNWADVPPAIYRLRGFRDLNGNRAPDADEPQAAYPYALEVRPLRELKELDLDLTLRNSPQPVPEENPDGPR